MQGTENQAQGWKQLPAMEDYAKEIFYGGTSFEESGCNYMTLEISPSAPGDIPKFGSSDKPANDIPGYMKHEPAPTESTSPQGSLRLVKIFRKSDGSILMPKKTFQAAFKACRLAPYLLHFLHHSSFVAHPFELHSSPSSSDSRSATSFYLNTAFFVLVWSFEAETLSTRAILF